MDTKIIKLDTDNIDYGELKIAADCISAGGLVAFPTETVYGLGADAENPEAVKNIFKAKGRPADNPLIVHVDNPDTAGNFVKKGTFENKNIRALAESFWPGPMTIICPKAEKVPDVVTAGLNTVGIRIPGNMIARELIRLSGKGIAAPSANISGKPSPTTGQHVINDLYGKVDIIIDSTNCDVGLESTVIDMSQDIPTILRPGGITREMIEDVLGVKPRVAGNLTDKDEIPRAPGMKYKHYSPKGEVIIFRGKAENISREINKRMQESIKAGIRAGILATKQTLCYYKYDNVFSMGDLEKPETIAAELFNLLRQMDSLDIEVIYAEAVSENGIGLAVMNRMGKAAGYKFINTD